MYEKIKYPALNLSKKLNLLKDAYLFACKKDIEVLKPGNVSLESPHHDTSAQDYIESSIYSSHHLFNISYSLGERVLNSVRATKKVVKTNTNLGIILLCAPIIHSLIKFDNIPIRDSLETSLSQSNNDDTLRICESINIVKPGGLGESIKYNTKSLPKISLMKIMQYSSEYDRISYQYTHKFKDILDFIVPCIKFHRKHSRSYEHSLALTFMEILSKIPDSHISRKFGNKMSKKTSNEANDLLKILDKEDSWDLASKRLKSLDYEYKKKGINPGTTADLLVAGLMVYKIFSSE